MLPPNSTHMLQPLDVAYFRPLKASWRKVLEEWKLKNRGVLPKTLFPRKLKEAIEGLGEKSKANAIAGFKACGLVPFNPDAVLFKLKRKTPSDDLTQSWSDTIVEHLDQLKTGPANIPKRGKKIVIVPGKSLTEQDLQEESEKQKIRKRSRRVVTSSDEEPETENNVEHSPSDNEEVEQEASYAETTNTIYEIGESSHLPSDNDLEECEPVETSDFIIVKFETKKRDRRFVAKVEEVLETEYTISALRKKDARKDLFFVYPQIQDYSVISKEQIVRKLRLKQLRRGRHYFNLNEEEAEVLE